MISNAFNKNRGILGTTLFFSIISSSFGVNAEEQKILLDAADVKVLQATETQLLSLIQENVKQSDFFGVDRSLVEMSAQKTAMMALESNIALQRGRLNDKAVDALLQQARAVFDPKFVLSLDYERSQNNDRTENVKQYLSSTSVNAEGENVLLIEEFQDPRVPEVVYTAPRDEGFVDTDIVAHAESVTGARKQLTIGAGLEQQLPWGGSVNLAYKAINRETFFINNPQLISGGTDVSKSLVGFGSYNRPWVSELALSMAMPIPGTKGFGEYSAAKLQRTRTISAKQQATHDLRSRVSNTLLAADLAYWDLLESALGLLTVQESMNAAASLSESTLRLYQTRSANNYDRAQTDLTLANTKAQADSQWSRYLSASDRLSLLLNMDSKNVIVPQGFAAMFEMNSNALLDDTVDLSTHSQFQSQQSASAILELDSQSGRQALMPDLQLSAGMALRQSSQVFGYADFSESLSAVFEPDIVTKNIGVAYTLPIANRGLKARSHAAEAKLKQSNDALLAKRHALESNLINAETALLGAVSTVGFSAQAVKLSEQSYTKALEKQRSRQVKEYELAGLHAALVSARLEHIKALINVQRERTRLLAAQDKLPEEQAQRLANNNFERWRLARLQEFGEPQMFLPQGGAQ